MVSAFSVDDFAVNNNISGSPTMVSGSATNLGFTSYSWNKSSRTLTLTCDPTKEVIFDVLFYYTKNYVYDSFYQVETTDHTSFTSSSHTYRVGPATKPNAVRYSLVGSNSGYTLHQVDPMTDAVRATVVAYTRTLV